MPVIRSYTPWRLKDPECAHARVCMRFAFVAMHFRPEQEVWERSSLGASDKMSHILAAAFVRPQTALLVVLMGRRYDKEVSLECKTQFTKYVTSWLAPSWHCRWSSWWYWYPWVWESPPEVSDKMSYMCETSWLLPGGHFKCQEGTRKVVPIYF